MVKGYFLMGGQELSVPFGIREEVFVKEQGFSIEIERDGADERAVHVVIEDDGGPCGTGRMYYDDGFWHMGRVAVLKEKRGLGYGSLIVRLLADRALQAGISEIYIGAQLTVRVLHHPRQMDKHRNVPFR